MSDPYVVLVTIDRAPWDPDATDEVLLCEFSGPDAADIFQRRAIEIAESTEERIIQVTPPEPVIRFGSSDDAIEYLREWIGE